MSILIKDMEIGKNFEVFNCEIAIINQTNEYEKDGIKRRVQDLVVKDNDGKTVTLVLWNSQTNPALGWEVGDKIIIIEGYCKEYEGNKQISTGKFGTISRIKTKKKSRGKK